MSSTTVFQNNRSQAVRLPADARFPEHVKRVDVRVCGPERVLAPAGQRWDSFFAETEKGSGGVSDDFLPERALQTQPERPPLWD